MLADSPSTVSVPNVAVPRFVGRQVEFARLGEALARPPVVVLIEGEAGIGKSRLLSEFLATQRRWRGRVLAAACPPFRVPYTLGAVVDSLRQSVTDLAGFRLSALAGALRPLFPEWVDRLPPTPEPLEDATAARHRLFGALAELLERMQVKVLVVEDLHWADDATLEFLLFLLARDLPDLSLVATFRPEDVPAGSLLLRLTSRAAGGGRHVRIELPPLGSPDTAELVSSMVDDEPVSAEFAEFIRGHTDGLPLAIEESVRLMQARRDLRYRNGEWVRRDLEDIAVPPTIRDAVLERVERLTATARHVANAAAVIADSADEVVLQTVSGLAEHEARASLAELLASGLLHEDDRGLFCYRHALPCRAIYDTIPPVERRAFHRRAGDALEHLASTPATQLARHFREARDVARWSSYAEQAADVALETGDHSTAVALLCDLVTGAELPAADLARLLSKVPLNLAGVDRKRGLVATLRAALDSQTVGTADEPDLRCQLAWVLGALDDWNGCRVELERAVPHLADNSAEAARVMTVLGWPQDSDWPASRHLEWLRRAAKVQAPMSAFERLRVRVNRVSALLVLGAEEGWEEAAQIPADAATPSERSEVTLAYMNIAESAMIWGRYEDARQRLKEGLGLASANNCEPLGRAMLATQAHLDWFCGAWEGLAARATALAEDEEAIPLVRLEARLITGLLHSAKGEHADAVAIVQHTLDETRRGGPIESCIEPAAVLAKLWIAEGAVAQALEVTDRLVGIIANRGMWLWATEIAPVRVRSLIAAGLIQEAADLVAAFNAGAATLDAAAPAASLVLCQAMLAQARCGALEATAFFEQAATAWRALPRPYDALLATEQRAACLLAAGQHDAGLTLLTSVVRQFSELGAIGDADRVARMLRGHGVEIRQAWRGGPRGYGDQLSPREVEVVRLVAAGKTNREIAEMLCRSPNTIGTQLSSAMRKLKVSSRAALAVRASETGLTAS